MAPSITITFVLLSFHSMVLLILGRSKCKQLFVGIGLVLQITAMTCSMCSKTIFVTKYTVLHFQVILQKLLLAIQSVVYVMHSITYNVQVSRIRGLIVVSKCALLATMSSYYANISCNNASINLFFSYHIELNGRKGLKCLLVQVNVSVKLFVVNGIRLIFALSGALVVALITSLWCAMSINP